MNKLKENIINFIRMISVILVVFTGLLFVSCNDDFDDIITGEEKIVKEQDAQQLNYSPVPGNSGLIEVSSVTSSGMSLSWAVADDDKTSVENLQYRVYSSSGDDISTLESAVANGTELTSNWVVNIMSFEVTGVSFNTVKFFNVIVRDENGKASSYNTLFAGIYLYSPGDYTGQVVLPTTSSVRAGIDSVCRASSKFNSLSLSNARGFISIGLADSIFRLADNYSIPKFWSIYGADDILLADNWDDLMDESINTHLKNGGVVTTNVDWWSGSNSNGNFDSTNNCNSWTSESNLENGAFGDDNKSNSDWLYSSFDSCNSTKSVVCIGW